MYIKCKKCTKISHKELLNIIKTEKEKINKINKKVHKKETRKKKSSTQS